jgi:hypothetical protein
MRQLLFVCAVLICFRLPAAAQDSVATFDASSAPSEPAAPASLTPSEREPWQLGVGFQFLHYKVLGTSFNDYGFQADITRYLNNWFGVEGQTLAGFGHTGGSPNLVAKSFFIGGGPHMAIRNTPRFEPWVQVLGGWERFRFSQTATLGVSSGAAFYAGGGVDYKISGGRLSWRVQGDYIGVHVGSSLTSNYAFGTGLVLNF